MKTSLNNDVDSARRGVRISLLVVSYFHHLRTEKMKVFPENGRFCAKMVGYLQHF